MKNISVIGSGTMGNGIAHLFAQQGFAVSLVDLSAEQLTKAFGVGSQNDRLDELFPIEKPKKPNLN